ncbi:MAG: RNA methyltransferase [Alphaproteobacteria bacterium]|nr:RNA methyltransferase [Alphaproteobacteria bacterium]
MRGYFGIGIEGASKAMNVGALFRTAHAFGAGFVFTVAADYDEREGGRADTSDATGNVPFYAFPDAEVLLLPKDCALIGIELLDDAVELPSFRHPHRAAYVLGRERGSLSSGMIARCDYIVKIPTAFCVNVGLAGAIVMYDRVLTLGRFPPRPVRAGGPTEKLPKHVYGPPVLGRKAAKYRASPPRDE